MSRGALGMCCMSQKTLLSIKALKKTCLACVEASMKGDATWATCYCYGWMLGSK